MSSNVEIKGKQDGPLLVSFEGATFIDAAGNTKTVEGKMVALCRCGQSANKPFCDGSHKKVGFVADAMTVSLNVL